VYLLIFIIVLISYRFLVISSYKVNKGLMLVIWHLFALWGLMFINIWLLNSSVMPIMSPDVYDVLMRPSKQQMACVSPARGL